MLARRVGLAARRAQRVEARRGRGERGREQLELAFEQRMALPVALVDGGEARDQVAAQAHQAVVGADDPEDDDGGDAATVPWVVVIGSASRAGARA